MQQGDTHQRNAEKELMEWFDRQGKDRKWRISACLISTGRPMAEILRLLKGLEEQETKLQLMHPGNQQLH